MPVRYGQPAALNEATLKLKDFKTCLSFRQAGVVDLGTEDPFSGQGYYVHMKVKWYGHTTAWQHLLSKRESYAVDQCVMDLAIDPANDRVVLDSGGAGQRTFVYNFPVGKWVSFVFVHDVASAKERLYINGEKVGDEDITGQGTGTSARIRIGACDTVPTEFFNGELDEVAIGVGSPTWADVIRISAKGVYASDTLSDTTYTSWGVWSFDEVAGTTALDSSGNGRNGTISGAFYTSNVMARVQSGDTLLVRTPDMVSGLIAHYAADNKVYSDTGTTLAVNGDRVPQWNDLAGSSNITNATVLEQPQYVANAINGRPALLFSNSRGDVLSVADNAILSTQHGVHMFAVVRQASIIAGAAGIVCKDAAGGITNPSYAIWLSNAKIILNCTTTGNSNQGTTATLGGAVGQDLIVEGAFDGQTLMTYQNGDLSFSVASAFTMADTAGALRIGAQKSGFTGRSFDGYIAEIIIYNRYLTANEREGVEKYLSEKYAITI